MTRADLEALLPEVFRRTIADGNLLDGLLEVMRALHAPAELVLRELPTYFDPYRTPTEFLPYLATWLDLDRFLGAGTDDPFPSGSGHLRELIASAARLSGLRGTAEGLTSFLELATGQRGFHIAEGVDERGQPRPFTVTIACPAAAAELRPLIERIVASEKPVHVMAHVTFAEAAGEAP